MYIYDRRTSLMISLLLSQYVYVGFGHTAGYAKRYQLVQKNVDIKDNFYRDELISPKAYQMTDTDRKCLSHLYRMRDAIQL
jgi:hypothetical protein